MADEQFEVEAIRAKRPIKTESGEEEFEYQVKVIFSALFINFVSQIQA